MVKFVEQASELADFRSRYAPISEKMRLSPESRARILANLHAEMEIRRPSRKRSRRKPFIASFVGVAVAALVTAVGTQGFPFGNNRLLSNGTLAHPQSTTHSATSATTASLNAPAASLLRKVDPTTAIAPTFPVSSAPLTGIQMCTATVGWQFETNGALLKTTDGGLTWNAVTPNLTAQAGQATATVLNTQTAWEAVAITHHQSTGIMVYRTVDGGHQWSAFPMTGQLAYAPGGQVPQSLTFVNAMDGWLTTRIVQAQTGSTLPGGLYRTQDGGQTWKLVSTGVAPGLVSFQNLYFLSNQIGFTTAVQLSTGVNAGIPDPSTEQLYRTTDGGTTWTPVSLPLGANNNGVVGTTGTGGGTTAGVTLYPPTFFKDGTGLLPVVKQESGLQGGSVNGGDSGVLNLYLTHDSGATWTLASEFRMAFVQGHLATDFMSPGVGFMAWNGMLISTTNGWVSVQRHTLPMTAGSVQWMSFDSSLHGYVMMPAANASQSGESSKTGNSGSGLANLFYETSDGGATWQPVQSGASGVFGTQNLPGLP